MMAVSASWLAACSLQAARQTLGIEKQSPDEYLVVERAPLSLPPNFDLRPPTPGAAQAQYVDLGLRPIAPRERQPFWQVLGRSTLMQGSVKLLIEKMEFIWLRMADSSMI